jgi:lipoate-protein ligase A
MIHLIDDSLADPAVQVDFDARLFQQLETGKGSETLRCWESERNAVVVSALARVSQQVHEDACRQDDVPILRRISGGGAVVIGPGCLNYTLILSLDARPELRSVPDSYCRILTSIKDALAIPLLAVRGSSDLAIGDRKISGNSQRRGRHALLHHGTILYNFDSALMDRYLRTPARAPKYRADRVHTQFVSNAPLTRQDIVQAISKVLC